MGNGDQRDAPPPSLDQQGFQCVAWGLHIEGSKATVMKKTLLLLALGAMLAPAHAQFQVNPQLGVTFQNMTDPAAGTRYESNVGYQLGVDFRIGDRIFFQPGAFLGRNATLISMNEGESFAVEDGLLRTNLTLRALAGYRIIDTYQFDLRFVMGPSYDVLLSVDDRNDRINFNQGDFNAGSFNVDMGLGFDMGHFTLQPMVSFGLSRVFKDNPVLADINSRYITYGMTFGVNFGDDDE